MNKRVRKADLVNPSLPSSSLRKDFIGIASAILSHPKIANKEEIYILASSLDKPTREWYKDHVDEVFERLYASQPEKLRKAYAKRFRKLLSTYMRLSRAFISPSLPMRLAMPFFSLKAVGLIDKSRHRFIIAKVKSLLPLHSFPILHEPLWDINFVSLPLLRKHPTYYFLLKDIRRMPKAMDERGSWPIDREFEELFGKFNIAFDYPTLSKNDIIVDLGTGSGAFLEGLLKEGYKAVGVTSAYVDHHSEKIGERLLSDYILYATLTEENIDEFVKCLRRKLLSLYGRDRPTYIFDHVGILYYTSSFFSKLSFARLVLKLYDMLDEHGKMAFIPSFLSTVNLVNLALLIRKGKKIGMTPFNRLPIFIQIYKD